ncbi:hypothetical protein AMAG_14153 [Allomyces macrogynus ATCC 38327]|uniref:Hsp70-like protein n=1 Tax=Allomyces macrogynus (strain ATCC 38327) TaxID=578462 RepID=A0A0L0T453_ALLM3|nr:hypothetical protein AMAG_14153 [Allomyces macrogynus ATCC 38327]|eukprot:KNE69598.1 hypothetical protein AMAG_14153 [Allomyces macrogynus ATCC 38327]
MSGRGVVVVDASQTPAPDDLLAAVYPIKWQIALDFGTSYSGFAIAVKDFASAVVDSAKTIDLASIPRLHLTHYIKYNSSWPGGRMPYAKTRTALLYDASGKAEHIYIDRFKLLLDAKLAHQGEAVDRLKALGKDAVEVIADYLRPLVTFLGEYIKYSEPTTELNPFHVRWCLTIPAMWSDAAKQKMYRAMFKADLIPSLTSERVIFCSEPMAGLLSEAISSDARTKIQRIDPILMVDMGCGTVDLTAMRMGTDGFDELVPGIGASCGATMLDDEFLSMFRRAVGPDVYDQVVAEHPKVELQILRDWETCKTTFMGEKRWFGRVPIPHTMEKYLDLDEVESSSSELDVGLNENELCLTTALMETLYEPIVAEIVGLVTTMLDRLQAKGISVAHVLCVGGFSQSKYLLSALRERLPINPLKIVASAHGPAAILIGAPIFACRPELIRTQVARLTYGIQMRTPYKPSVHGPRERLRDRLFMCDDGITRVHNAFDVVIRKGDSMVLGQVITKSYVPADCSHTEVWFNIYVSHLEDPVYTDTVGCDKVGTVTIKVTACTQYSKKDPLVATVRVEHTGLVLEVKNKRTGVKVGTTVDFYD